MYKFKFKYEKLDFIHNKIFLVTTSDIVYILHNNNLTNKQMCLLRKIPLQITLKNKVAKSDVTLAIMQTALARVVLAKKKNVLFKNLFCGPSLVIYTEFLDFFFLSNKSDKPFANINLFSFVAKKTLIPLSFFFFGKFLKVETFELVTRILHEVGSGFDFKTLFKRDPKIYKDCFKIYIVSNCFI